MTSEPGTRASDQDRERTAVALGGHYAAGRLSLEEFQERLDQAYAAKTLGELGDLVADLPGNDLSQLPGQPGGNPLPGRRAPGTVQAPGGSYPAVWQFWLTVTIGVFVIWLLSGASGGLWLLWVAIALAFILLRRRITGGGCRGRPPGPGGRKRGTG
jgi:hypothetical protein